MSDFLERITDHNEVLQLALDSRQTQMWTAQPGIVTKVSDLAGKITVDVRPAIQGKMRKPSGETMVVDLPVIPDVPVTFPRGGGYVMTFPIAVNDEVLLVHAARNIDGWWQSGGVAPPLDSRMHDLSDAFVVPGPYSQTSKFSGLSTTTAQLRTHDGTYFVEIDQPNKKVRIISGPITAEFDNNAHAVNISGADTAHITANNQVTVTAPLTVIEGDLHVTGAVIGGFGGGDQIGLMTHTHTQGNDSHGDGEQPTNPPTPGS